MTFENKMVLITGGGTGIGRALAIQLARLGSQVIISWHNKESLLVATAMTQGNGNGKITPDQLAIAIVEGLRQGKDLIKAGKSKMVYFLDRFFPKLVANMMVRT